jgi:RNA polymerase sigma-70 factor (ECF subfamily)
MQQDTQEKLFKQWLAEYDKLIFKVVRAYAVSPQDQDDLFQDILLQLWNSVPGFDGNAAESTWIYRVALNTALVWKRTEIRKQKRSRTAVIDFNEVSATESDTSASNDGIIKQLYENIRKLEKIDGSLILMHLDGLSYDQMAEVIGISKNNVGVRLNRAKRKFGCSKIFFGGISCRSQLV